jgi:glycerol-3-phosphate dehydrogenase
MIHGGIRYLQHGDIVRMRRSIRFRRRLLALKPHLVRPMPFLLPTVAGNIQNNFVMRLALLANDAISWDRNRHLPQDRHIPNGRTISKAKRNQRLIS